MQGTVDNLGTAVRDFLPNLLGALAILIIGWIIALVVAAVVRRLLKRTTVDDRLAAFLVEDNSKAPLNIEQAAGTAAFWLIMLFVLLAFFEALGLTAITVPLNQFLNAVLLFIPLLIGAAILILIAWVVATILRMIVRRALTAAKIDQRLSSGAGVAEPKPSLAITIGDAVYWLVFLLFLPAILQALGLQGLLVPIQNMFTEVFSFLPKLLGAAIILLIGWLVARIVQRLVTNLLAAAGLDRLSTRAHIDNVLGRQSLSGLVGLIVYILILIPVLIAALDALQLGAITQPASAMLTDMLTAIPRIFAALMILVITYIVARIVASLVTSILTAIGFDTIPARLGLHMVVEEGQRTPSQFAGYLVLVVIMLLAAMEASQVLGFTLLATMLEQVITFVGQVVMGLIIIAIGLYLANLARRWIMASGVENARLLSILAQVAILVLAGAMGLRQMGFASEIINLAFALLIGAVAVAVAIAFGLGGRDVAGRELESWVDSNKGKNP